MTMKCIKGFRKRCITFLVVLLFILVNIRFETFSNVHLEKNEEKQNRVVEQFVVSTIQVDTEVSICSVISRGNLDQLAVRTAIQSWKDRVSSRNVILLSDTKNECENAFNAKYNINCLTHNCTVTGKDKKYSLSCIYDSCVSKAETKYLMYANNDIEIAGDILNLRKKIHLNSLIFAKSYDYPQDMLEKYLTWNRIKRLERIVGSGRWNSPYEIDLFFFQRDTWNSIAKPSEEIPNHQYNNWMLDQLLGRSDIRIWDASRVILPIHPSFIPENSNHTKEKVKYFLGSIEHAPYTILHRKIKNKKKNTSHQKKANIVEVTSSNLENIFDRRKFVHIIRDRRDKNNRIAVCYTSSAYMKMVRNWLCSAHSIGFYNYIFIAEDNDSYEALHAMNEPVFLRRPVSMSDNESDYGTAGFQYKMLERVRVIQEILQYSSVLSFDGDQVWLGNPLKVFRNNTVIGGQRHRENLISGGLVYIKSDEKGQKFWGKIVECQLKNYREILRNNKNALIMSEQECINAIRFSIPVSERQIDGGFNFVDGKRFFETFESQKSGKFPLIVHNNWIKTIGKKIGRFKDWNLWLYNEENDKCNTLEGKRTLRKKEPLHLLIRVLTQHRVKHLSNLLQSLRDAKYDGDKVDLHISIDYANGQEKEVVELSTVMQWEHGHKRITQHKTVLGVAGNWLQDYDHPTDGHLMLVVEDDVILSPEFYRYIKMAYNIYISSPDPLATSIYGIALQRQHAVLQESKKRRYGSFDPYSRIPHGHDVFFYQLFSTWGTAFTPDHWSNFLNWVKTKNLDDKSFCIPAFVTNKWMQRGNRTWSHTFVKYAFENGLFALYYNFNRFDSKKVKYALSVNMKATGNNFNSTNAGIVDFRLKPANVDISSIRLPSIREVPVYDFSFTEVELKFTLSLRKRLFSKLNASDLCSSF